MRDTKRISKILKELERIWNKSPDLERLGHLLINIGISPDSVGFWNLEDDDILNHLKKTK